MSFSADLKAELFAIRPERDCCKLTELAALYMTIGSLSFLGKGKLNVQFISESLPTVKRALVLLQETLDITPQIHYVSTAHFGGMRKCVLTLGPIQTPVFLLKMQMFTRDESGETVFRSASPKISLSRGCCNRAFLRAALMGGGYMTNPDQDYHLELGYKDEDMREYLARALQRNDLPIHQSSRKGKNFLYLKQCDQILDFLTLTGAHQTVMRIEELRVKRNVLSRVTRVVNCDNANMQKQVAAAEEQTRAIMLLAKKDGLKGLPPSLQQIAVARLNAPDLNLAQLGQNMDPPLSKSAVNHRMRRLMELARDVTDDDNSSPEEIPGDENEV